jgi:hypothetical protein
MRWAIRPERTGLAKGPCIASVGLHFAASLGVHRCKVRVRHNHFVTELLQALRHPLAFRRGLDQDAGPVSLPEPFRKARSVRPHPPLDELPHFGPDADYLLD